MSPDGVFIGFDQVGDLRVREAHSLGPHHEFMIDILKSTAGFESVVSLDNVVDLVQEPLQNNGVSTRSPSLEYRFTYFINLRQIVYFVHGITFVIHSVGDDEQPHIRRLH